MDRIDSAIIDVLREHGRISNAALAAKVGLTPAPCLRRVRALEADGVITGYAARLDPAKTGRGFEVLVFVEITRNGRDTLDEFEETLLAMDEVTEMRRMFSVPDYVLTVSVESAEVYEAWIMGRLLRLPTVARAESHLPLRLLKSAR